MRPPFNNTSKVRTASKLTILCVMTFSAMSCAGVIPGSAPHVYLGQSVPPLASPVLGGRAMANVPQPGQVTVAYFWATTCRPCVASMPKIDTFYRKHRARGLNVVGITLDTSPGEVMNFLRAHRISFPVVLDGDHRQFFGKFRFGSDVPHTLIFDRQGRLRMYIQNKAPNFHAKLRRAVKMLL